MEIIKLLRHDWGYPVISNPRALQLNTRALWDHLVWHNHFKAICFTSIGSSGAMLLGAMAGQYGPPCVLLRKTSDPTEQGHHFTAIPDMPLVILDDHVTYGRALREIQSLLVKQSRDKNVLGVVCRCWNQDHPDNMSFTQGLITELFPTAKFWIH